MLATKEDLFIQVLLRWKIVSDETAKEYKSLQKKYQERGENISVAQLLVELGRLERSQVEEIWNSLDQLNQKKKVTIQLDVPKFAKSIGNYMPKS